METTLYSVRDVPSHLLYAVDHLIHIRTPPFRAAGRYQAVITTCKEKGEREQQHQKKLILDLVTERS